MDRPCAAGRHNVAAAERNSAEVRKLCLAELAHRKLDAEPHLPTALGAAIEVEGQALAAQNRRDEAVLFLGDELKKWQSTSVSRSNTEKHQSPDARRQTGPGLLDIAQGIGSRRPLPLSAHRGHPVLLFLWRNWCSDCKNEVAIVQKLMANYGPRGLVWFAPTQHYGYVAGGQDAPPMWRRSTSVRSSRSTIAGTGARSRFR